MRFIRRVRLVDWCLQVITENLTLFINNKTLPQKQIDFLHRVYCREIFLRYKSSNSISEDCMLWFLNLHSKRVFLSPITEKVIKQLQVVGSNITSLSLYQSLAAENLLNSIVCCVRHVKHLNLSETFCSDRTLLCIQRMCPEIVHLNIRDCDAITDKGMVNLCGGSGNLALEYLDMMFTHVELSGLHTILRTMPSLQCVKYENMASSLYCIHKQEFSNGTCKRIQYGLTEMIYDRIQYYEPSQVVMLWTIICPKVRKVNFKFLVCEEALQACTRFEHLTDINIARSIFDDYVMNDVMSPILQTWMHLRTLILSSVRMSVVSLLENFKNLKCLHLHQVVFIDSVEGEIKTSEMKLDTLVITNMDFKTQPDMYKAIALLISLSKNVKRLHLTHLKNLPQDIFHIILNTMKSLNFVNFSYSQVQVNNVIPFFRIPSMEMVYLDLCACFAVDQHPMFQTIMAHRSNCTLSWRSMIDSIDEYDSDILSD